MPNIHNRRTFVRGFGAVALGSVFRVNASSPVQAATIELGPPSVFSFDELQRKAEALASRPFVQPRAPAPEILAQITYDEYQRIRYRADHTIRLGTDGSYPLQLFHLGKYARDPVRVSIVDDGSQAREIIYRNDLFDIPEGHPGLNLPAGAGFAGLRIMTDDLKSDWFSAIGASYFRSSGPYDQYGLSARAIAINTATQEPEEFPRFTHFWLAGPRRPGEPLKIFALLDGPSLTGAVEMQTSRDITSPGVYRVVNEIGARFFLRKDIRRVGIAPFSSMFWYGEARNRQPVDWRPEIHDSDGLAILTGTGERLWRPLLNPPHIMTNSFIDENVKGFGLLQRDRTFDHYLDDGVFYDRRPSVWVEPLGDWGAGAIQLVEMPTGEETWDNVVAYWTPKESWKAGQAKSYRYRLSWLDDIPFPATLARAIGTWTGFGGPPGLSYKDRQTDTRKFVIDFEGKNLVGIGRDDGVEVIVSVSRGTIANAASHPVVTQPDRWRALFDINAEGDDPVDLRAYLRKNNTALTETWVYQHFPDTLL